MSGTLRAFGVVAALAAIGPAAVALASPRGSVERAVAVAIDPPLPRPVSARDLEVVWDGEGLTPSAVQALPEAGAWRVLVYLDAPLSTPEGLLRSLDALSRQAPRLAALGPVELVLADPAPRPLLAPGRDPARLRARLGMALDEAASTGELLWLRQRFEAAPPAEAAETTRALRLELELRERQDADLIECLEARAGEGPAALVLVRDGYELESAAFYHRGPNASAAPALLERRAHAELERRVAAAGWTTVALAAGDSHPELPGARVPLDRLAFESGGEVVTSARGLGPALAGLGRRLRVAFDPGPDSTPESRPLQVRVRGRRRPARALRWLTAAPRATSGPVEAGGRRRRDLHVIRLAPPAGEGLRGTIRVGTLVGGAGVDRVDFLLDGRLAASAEGPPFAAILDLGSEVRPRELLAVAYDALGALLGEDAVALNAADRRAEARIVSLREEPAAGVVEVFAEVDTLLGDRVSRVEFFWNQELAATLDRPPYRARLEVGRAGRGDYARVVAQLAGGERLEAVQLAGAAGPGDRLRVNLVEVYAVVTGRDGRPRQHLERTDFRLLQDGEQREIEGFAAARDLPLELGLAIDTSSSMRDWLPEMRRTAARFLERVLGADDRAFLIDFNDRPRLVQPATRDRELLLRRFSGLQARGRTVLYDAVLFALRQFDHRARRKALVVLTDGEDAGSRFGQRRCIRQAVAFGVPVYVVRLGFADAARNPFVMLNRRLARKTGGRLHTLEREEELEAVYEEIEAELRSQYVLTFSTPRALSEREERALRVEMADPELAVRAVVGGRGRG